MDDKSLPEELSNKEADLEVQDFGDAMKETKQQSHPGPFADCYFYFSSKWGC